MSHDLWKTAIAALLLALLAPSTLLAQTTRWGIFEEIAKRGWTTDGEARPRASSYRWIEPGRVLEARHGFVSRLQFGEDKFADTIQRFVLDPATGTIGSTYTYEGGRPPLKTTILIESDGSAVETFTDANGVQKRNIYRSPTHSLNTIERQEMRGTSWASLGTTRKVGLTQAEIAESQRRAEEAQQLAIAQQRAAAAEARARMEMELASSPANQEPEPQEPMGAVFLRELQGMARQAKAEADESRRQLDRSIANAHAQAAAERARAAREEVNRLAAENQRRIAEANARQEAIAGRSGAAPDPASRVVAQPSGEQADLARANAEREARLARAADVERAAEARAAEVERERQRREADTRQAEEARVAEQRRKQEEANRPIEFKEGIVVCEKQRENYFRCDGPLQVTYSDLASAAGRASLAQACGANSVRDLGSSGGYRIFGCGFGIHPTSNYPGNRDTPATYGLYISDRATFFCPRSTSAYCRNR